MRIRAAEPADLDRLTTLTIETFRPLFEDHWPKSLGPVVFEHDHGRWQDNYRVEVPALLDPDHGKYVTVAESEDGALLGYVGWRVTGDGGRMELVAVAPPWQRQGVGRAICQHVLDRMRAMAVTVVHVGTGGDEFHAPARGLYESLGFSGLPVVDYTQAL